MAATTGPPACGRTARRCGSLTTRTAPATRSTPTTAPAANASAEREFTLARDEPGTARLLVRPQCRLGLRQRPRAALRIRPRHGGAPGGARVRAGRTQQRRPRHLVGRGDDVGAGRPHRRPLRLRLRERRTARRVRARLSQRRPPRPLVRRRRPSGFPTTGRSASSPTACPCCRMQRRTPARRTRTTTPGNSSASATRSSRSCRRPATTAPAASGPTAT